ncbi:MAG TPA: sigma-70 family RNA polymerase sigma factor [Polyangiaceae bacterium]
MAPKIPNHRLALYLAQRADLVSQASRILGSRTWAEDVVQEAYLRFVSADGIAESVLKPNAYLARIVRNLATDWARHSFQGGQRELDDAKLESIATSALTPEQAAEYRNELRLIAAALAELPERTRKAFEMNRLKGQTLLEITQELGISVTLAHQLVKRAQLHCASRVAPKSALDIATDDDREP